MSTDSRASSIAEKIELVKQNIKNYPNFPKPGIMFRDIFPVLKDPDASQALFDLLLSHCTDYVPPVDAICSVDSRGFLFGPLIANHFHIPFVPIRKKGKLPGQVKSVTYELEYGVGGLEIQTDALKPGTNVMLVDDLLATGGTLTAGCELVASVGSVVSQCLVIIEIEAFNGRNRVPAQVYSLVKV